MNDLISKKAVYKMLHDLGGCDAADDWSKGWDKAIDEAIEELDDIPTVNQGIEQSIICDACGWRSPDNCRVCRADRERNK